MNRKGIPLRRRLNVFKRDNYTCRICGKSGVPLEADHVIPHSKGGSDEESNLQTLCEACNRGKGNIGELNKTFIDDLKVILNKINPQILKSIQKGVPLTICSNSEDFTELQNLAKNFNSQELLISIIPNAISGFGNKVGNFIYPINDNSASKNLFRLTIFSSVTN